MASLYQDLLGARFELLHPILRRFHSSTGPCGGRGRFQVTRQPGWLCAALAKVLALPAPAEDVPVTLNVIPTKDGERWHRSFGGLPFDTRQSSRGGLLLEAAGPICFGLHVDVVEQGLLFTTRRVWICGLPLWRRLAPSVWARAAADREGWTVTVTMSLPMLGELITYRGRIVPEWK